MKNQVEKILAALIQVRKRFQLLKPKFLSALEYVKMILQDRYSSQHDYECAAKQLLALADAIKLYIYDTYCARGVLSSDVDHLINVSMLQASELATIAADIQVDILHNDVRGAVALEQAATLLPKTTVGSRRDQEQYYNFEMRWRCMQEKISQLYENAMCFQQAIDAERRLIDYFAGNSAVDMPERDPLLAGLMARFFYTDGRRVRVNFLLAQQETWSGFSKTGYNQTETKSDKKTDWQTLQHTVAKPPLIRRCSSSQKLYKPSDFLESEPDVGAPSWAELNDEEL